jgi:hypothetical protein
MRRDSRRVKVVIENSTTHEVRTVNFTLTTLTNDCRSTIPPKERVVIIRRTPSLKRLSKVRVKVI